MNGYSSIPANYQNSLYWQYFMKSLQDAQAMSKARAEAIQQQAQAQAQAQAQTQSAVDTTQFANNTAAAQQTQPAQTPAFKNTKDGKVYVVADGKDDGYISGGQKLLNFGKGVGNFFKGMVCGKDGKFSLLQTAKTVGLVALGIAVPAIGVGMLAVGGAMSVYTVGKGIVKANAAKTDADAEKAWQNIGEGATGVVMTVTGAKALKSSKAASAADAMRYKGIKGYGRAIKDVYVDAGKGIKKGYTKVREDGVTQSLKDGWSSSKEYVGNQWEARFKSSNAKDNAKSRMEAAYDKQIMKHETKILELEQKIAGSKNAKKSAEWRQEITDLRAQIAENIKAKSEIPEMPQVDYSKAKVKNINKRINQNNKEAAQIRKDNPNIDTQIQYRANLKKNYPKELAKYDTEHPQVVKFLKLEKDVNTLKALKQRTIDRPSVDGYRQNQIDRFTKLEAIAKAKGKNAKGAEKAKWKTIEEQAKLRIKENEKFRFLEQAQETTLKANRELADLNIKLKDVEAKIKAETNPEKITDLNIEKARIESKISSNKIAIQSAKNQMRRGYHYQNITSYIKDNHKPIGYGTMAAASGDIEAVDTYTPEQLNAMMNGFASPEEMEEYLKAQQEQVAAQSTQSQQTQQTQTTVPPYTSAVTNPYGIYPQMNPQSPFGTTGLEFPDLYQSPYQGLY